jgi:peptidoglycan hydrolase-like protein with peptidoglycan-binding domain
VKLARPVLVALVCAGAFAGGAAAGAAQKSTQKSPAKATSKPASKSPAKTSAKSAKQKKKTSKSTARRASTQQTPDQARVREIQHALAARGYNVDVTGSWGPQSAEALKKFQEDQNINNLSGRGKLDSLTLIALGLGPNRPPAVEGMPRADSAKAPEK